MRENINQWLRTRPVGATTQIARCACCAREADTLLPSAAFALFGYQHGGTVNDDVGTAYFAYCLGCALPVCAQDAGFPASATESEAVLFPPQHPLPCPRCAAPLFLYSVPNTPAHKAIAHWQAFLAAPYAIQPQPTTEAIQVEAKMSFPLLAIPLAASAEPLRIGEAVVVSLTWQQPKGASCQMTVRYSAYPMPMAEVQHTDAQGNALSSFPLLPEHEILSSLAFAAHIEDGYWATERFQVGISGEKLLVAVPPSAEWTLSVQRGTALLTELLPAPAQEARPYVRTAEPLPEQKERVHAAHYLDKLTRARIWDYWATKAPEEGRERPRAELVLEGSTNLFYYTLSRVAFKGVRFFTVGEQQVIHHPAFWLCSAVEEALLRGVVPFGERSFAVRIEGESFSVFARSEYVVCDRLFGEIAEEGETL